MTAVEYIPYILSGASLIGVFVRIGQAEGQFKTKQEGLEKRLTKVEDTLSPLDQTATLVTKSTHENSQKACRMQLRTEIESSQNKILGEIGQIRTLIEEHTRTASEGSVKEFAETLKQMNRTLQTLKT